MNKQHERVDNMKKIKVEVNLKENIMDPQGQAVLKALQGMDVPNIEDVRIGKVFYLSFEGEIPEKQIIESFCDKLLSNPVIENFKIINE